MRALLSAFGTRGDVQPMFALGLELQRRGHQVRMACPPDFADWIRARGLEVLPLGEPIKEFMARISDREGKMQARKAMKAMPVFLGSQFPALTEAAQDADVLIGASLTIAHVSLAEKLGKPCHTLAWCPQLLPSGEHPSPGFPSQTLPAWLNRLSFSFSSWGHRWLIKPAIDRERAKLGLRPSGETWDHIVYQRLIMASEPAIAALPADRRAEREVFHVGAFFLPEPEPLSEATQAFLAAGPPPIFVGFGSMPVPPDSTLERAVVEAAARVKVRLIVQGERFAPFAGPEVHVAGAEPHGQLFARCAAIGHHGGAGTTAQTARAGVPQIIFPFIVDQFFWSHRLEKLGVRAAAIDPHRATVEAVAAGFEQALRDDALRARSAELAKKVITDGTTRAAEVIEATAAKGSPLTPTLSPGGEREILLAPGSGRSLP
ncbi:MAG: glycosyltransferase [Myxococcaceae bacterium]